MSAKIGKIGKFLAVLCIHYIGIEQEFIDSGHNNAKIVATQLHALFNCNNNYFHYGFVPIRLAQLNRIEFVTINQ